MHVGKMIRMRVSFDIDDTLIVPSGDGRNEPSLLPQFMARFLPPLRLGACGLFRELRKNNCEIWIYTTSMRSSLQIRIWLLSYGICVDGIVNYAEHQAMSKRKGLSRMPSKHPSLFGIHLHIDDSAGVEIEGRQYGFSVLVIEPDDVAWCDKVLARVSAF